MGNVAKCRLLGSLKAFGSAIGRRQLTSYATTRHSVLQPSGEIVESRLKLNEAIAIVTLVLRTSTFFSSVLVGSAFRRAICTVIASRRCSKYDVLWIGLLLHE